ncbi:hypothetical protein [Eubacterium aggregans]|uniref:hypothetical protein n=1 Tax=Eubacterium aggregans TaxID=81409 RepID=UPI003F36F950
MNMMYFTFDQMTGTISTVWAIIAVLVVRTNIIAQVIKQIYKAEGVPAQTVVAVVAIILTIVAMVVTLITLKQFIYWYYWPVSIIAGLIVAYGAMFEYDNLYHEIMQAFKPVETIKEDNKNE